MLLGTPACAVCTRTCCRLRRFQNPPVQKCVVATARCSIGLRATAGASNAADSWLALQRQQPSFDSPCVPLLLCCSVHPGLLQPWTSLGAQTSHHATASLARSSLYPGRCRPHAALSCKHACCTLLPRLCQASGRAALAALHASNWPRWCSLPTGCCAC